MYTGINVQHLIPDKFVIEDPKSASKAIIKKELMRIPPRDPTPYGKATNPAVSFFVSTPTDYLDLRNSYFELVEVNPSTRNGNFGRSGIHTAFERIEIRGLGSTQIQEVDQYHVWSGLCHDMFEEKLPSQVDDFLQEATPYGNMRYAGKIQAAYTKAAGTYAINLATSPDYYSMGGIEVGDLFYDITQSLWTEVGTATNGVYTAVLVNQGADTPVANVRVFRYNKKPRLLNWYFRPKLSFFELVFPLFVLKQGIEIRFYWADVNIALTLDNSANTGLLSFGAFNFWGMFINAHPDITSETVAQWQTPAGLLYYLPSVRTRVKDTSTVGTTDEFSFNFNVRSARQMYVQVYPSYAFSSVATSGGQYDITVPIHSDIKSYLCRVGAYLFPMEKVTTGSTLDVRFLRELKQMMLTTRSINRDGMKADPEFMWSRTNDFKLTGLDETTGSHFRLVTDFSRHDGAGAELTGLDLTCVNVDGSIERVAGVAGIVYKFVALLVYDGFLKMSQQQMARIE